MHVVLTNPFVWPYVRRGSERLLNDLSVYFRDRGHRVTVIALAPHDRREERDGITYRLLRQRLDLSLRQLNSCHYFAFRVASEIEAAAPDAVFCLNYFDAYAALRARDRSARRYTVAFVAVGIPTRGYFRAVPLDAWFMRKVVREADRCAVLSEFARERLAADFRRDATVLPPPVRVEDFALPPRQHATTPGGPRILFVGDVNEPRKGARALCEAFAIVRRSFPQAQLIFSGNASAETQAELRAMHALHEAGRDAVRFLGLGRVEDLPALYRDAHVTVLPAVWEAFGLVLVESLAAGTPVVGARHAGIVDIVDGGAEGKLFDPHPFREQTANSQGLAEAILQVLALGKTSGVVAACRARAARFSWSALGPRYEQLLGNGIAA